MSAQIPFNRPYLTGAEFANIAEANAGHRLAGDGPFTHRCHDWLRAQTGCASVLLTHSCTAALEMAALLLNLHPGDEVIMPSFTFVSTANAFVLRGVVPVFVDIRADTLNIDEQKIEAAITPRTRAIVVVHYAGVACEMIGILGIAAKHGLSVVEDAAQGVSATYHRKALGTFGVLGAYSFHETKNVISGEGGALLVNDASLVTRAEMVRDKGTDRSRFFRGEVDKYTWQGLGSSFLPGEITAAFLWAQLQEAHSILVRRMEIWNRYHTLLESLEAAGLLRRPIVPDGCGHNAHMYYVLISARHDRRTVLNQLVARGIHAVSHYVPLHSAPAGRRYARVEGSMSVTDALADQLIRLPMWIGLTLEMQERVVAELLAALLPVESV